jgi:hypothetical protein
MPVRAGTPSPPGVPAHRPTTCDGCGAPTEQPRSGRRRRWCSDRCRKRTLYAGTCETCGAATDGSNGRAAAPTQCTTCQHRAATAAAVWPPEALIAEARRWHRLTGLWPTSTDWHSFPGHVRKEVRTTIADFRAATGPWPSSTLARNKFGTWAAFMDAAGGHAIGKGGKGRSRNNDRAARLRALRAATAKAVA